MHTAILSIVCGHSKNRWNLNEFGLYLRIKNAHMQSNEHTTNQLNFAMASWRIALDFFLIFA